MRLLFFPLILASALSLSACSKLSVGVYWADTFALSQLDDFFSLNSARRAAAQKEFQTTFAEVRRNEFPQIAAILDGIAQDVEAGALTEGKLDQWSERATKTLQTAAQRFEPFAQKLVEEQAGRGFARFDEEMGRRLQKAREKLETPEDRLKQAKKRIERVVSETVGELTEEQEALVEPVLRENPLLLEQESRAHLFDQFRKARGKSAERKAFLHKYFFDWDSLQRPEYIQAREAYRKKSISLMVRLLQGASSKQKAHLVDSFRGRAEEFRKLARVK